MKLRKTTTRGKSAGRRWYDDACGTAHALELVGERWSLLIVRELMFGARRFGELRSQLPGISANILTQRLDGLGRAGILRRRRLPSPANVQVYELTEWGYESEVVIRELGRWAARSPDHDPSLPLSPASLMLSFRTMIDRGRSGARPMTAGFRFGADTFVARVDEEGIAVTRAEPAEADFVIAGDQRALAAVVYGGQTLAAAEAAGALEVSGDRDLFAHFVTLFVLPAKFAPAP